MYGPRGTFCFTVCGGRRRLFEEGAYGYMATSRQMPAAAIFEGGTPGNGKARQMLQNCYRVQWGCIRLTPASGTDTIDCWASLSKCRSVHVKCDSWQSIIHTYNYYEW
jgi:hypothetical protein